MPPLIQVKPLPSDFREDVLERHDDMGRLEGVFSLG
jgi:hypothetical protein